ncbi:MAG: PAS domain S-box protein [Spirochaetes bacterium]|nr:PAS domain S-box protein [Spirochaetota bacterium]
MYTSYSFPELILSIIEEFTDGFLILDSNRRIIFFNSALQNITGWKGIDFIKRETVFLQSLDLTNLNNSEEFRTVPAPNGTEHAFKASLVKINNENGIFYLIRLRPLYEKESEEEYFLSYYDRFLNNIGDPVVQVDLNGKVIKANTGFYRLLCYDRDEIPDDISSLYVYPAAAEDKLAELTKNGSVFNLETHLYTKNRKIVRVLDTSWVMKDKNGTIKGYTTQFKDISYREKLEKRLAVSEKSYLMLFESILSSIIIVDPFGVILNCNYTAETTYGYKWNEIVGSNIDELFKIEKEHKSFKEIRNLVDTNNGRYLEEDVPRICKDRTIKYLFISYSTLKNSEGETIAYMLIEKDLTERIKLEKKLKSSVDQVKKTQSAAILGFARLTEYRDKDTGKHLKRIREYTRVLARGLQKLAKYQNYITDDYIEDIYLSSVLHDVGKVGIEDSILLKPGRLTSTEFNRIKLHSKLGGDALSAVDSELELESFLTLGKEIAYFHHERWDGTGYPEGRKGEEIPLSARIVALADVYDALTSERHYKHALSHRETVNLILSEKGTHFDPDIVNIFLDNEEVFKRIKLFETFSENPESIDDILSGST